jgi:PEP-CTERM motif
LLNLLTLNSIIQRKIVLSGRYETETTGSGELRKNAARLPQQLWCCPLTCEPHRFLQKFGNFNPMKIMNRFWMLAVLAVTFIAHGQGVIIQHSGAADPMSEGFSLNMGAGSVGPLNNDQGMNAWITSIPSSASTLEYMESLTPLQQAELAGQDWTMSATLQVVQSSGTLGNIFLNFYAGSEMFTLFFGAESNDDPFVRAGSSSLSPIFVLNGAGSTYNSYQLVYNVASDTANLWVNDTEEISDITGTQSSQAAELAWGIAQSGPSSFQANWNLVSLSVPEPSASWLVFLGSGVLFYVRRNRKFLFDLHCSFTGAGLPCRSAGSQTS